MALRDDSTTVLHHLRNKTYRFVWGQILEIMDIGPYSIASYHPHQNKDGRISMKIDDSRTQFHGWLDGQDTGRAWHTLDEALVGLVAFRAEGPNSRAAEYFSKMIAQEEN